MLEFADLTLLHTVQNDILYNQTYDIISKNLQNNFGLRHEFYFMRFDQRRVKCLLVFQYYQQNSHYSDLTFLSYMFILVKSCRIRL